MTTQNFIRRFALAMTLAVLTAPDYAKAAPAPINTTTGLNIQEYWRGVQPRYWIGNRSASPLEIKITSQPWQKANTAKVAPSSVLLKTVPPNGVIDIDASPYLGVYRIQFRATDNTLIGELASPRRVSASMNGTELRLYSALNGTVAPQYNVWYSLPHDAYSSDKTMVTTLNVIGFSGVVGILPGDKTTDGMTVTKVQSNTSPVSRDKKGNWFVDTRKLSKVSSLQTLEITCDISDASTPTFGILHASMGFSNAPAVSLDRGFLIGAVPPRQPVTKFQPFAAKQNN